MIGEVALRDVDVDDAEKGEIFLLVKFGCVEYLHADDTRVVDVPSCKSEVVGRNRTQDVVSTKQRDRGHR